MQLPKTWYVTFQCYLLHRNSLFLPALISQVPKTRHRWSWSEVMTHWRTCCVCTISAWAVLTLSGLKKVSDQQLWLYSSLGTFICGSFTGNDSHADKCQPSWYNGLQIWCWNHRRDTAITNWSDIHTTTNSGLPEARQWLIANIPGQHDEQSSNSWTSLLVLLPPGQADAALHC